MIEENDRVFFPPRYKPADDRPAGRIVGDTHETDLYHISHGGQFFLQILFHIDFLGRICFTVDGNHFFQDI